MEVVDRRVNDIERQLSYTRREHAWWRSWWSRGEALWRILESIAEILARWADLYHSAEPADAMAADAVVPYGDLPYQNPQG